MGVLQAGEALPSVDKGGCRGLDTSEPLGGTRAGGEVLLAGAPTPAHTAVGCQDTGAFGALGCCFVHPVASFFSSISFSGTSLSLSPPPSGAGTALGRTTSTSTPTCTPYQVRGAPAIAAGDHDCPASPPSTCSLAPLASVLPLFSLPGACSQQGPGLPFPLCHRGT